MGLTLTDQELEAAADVMERVLVAELNDERALTLIDALIVLRGKLPCTCCRSGGLHDQVCRRYVPGHDLLSPGRRLARARAEIAAHPVAASVRGTAMTAPALKPAAQKLLLELARRDKGGGVAVKCAGRDRWHLDGVSTEGLYNTRNFPALCAAGLACGWDEYGDSLMRITEAGRKVAAELEAEEAERQEAKKARAQPNPDGVAALRLLREIAKYDQPVPVHDDGLRRVWSLGSRDGHRASIDTWMALAKAGRIRIERVSSIGGHRVSITDAGTARLSQG